MDVFARFRDAVRAAAAEIAPGIDASGVTVEAPRDPSHGDLATNAALALAKAAGRKPRELAEQLALSLGRNPEIASVEIAGPGFINLRVADQVWRAVIPAALAAGTRFGDSKLGGGARVNVEYVSANPTGPLHVGHVRGAVYGDALAALLEKAGYAVTREYYVNDAGEQMRVLSESAFLRYREALGESIGEIPAGLYPGEYLKEIGRDLALRDGAKWLHEPEEARREAVTNFAVGRILSWIKTDLRDLGVSEQIFTHERDLHQEGAVKAACEELRSKGLVYTDVLEPPKGKTPDDWEPREQLLFKAKQFGDDTDRPLQKSNLEWTYFAADVAYHWHKIRRGFTDMIDVWGADHGGYVKRMQAAVKALSEGRAALDVKLCQLVRVMRAGEPVRMSKRAGDFITLRDVLDEVGRDVVRFIMLTRRNDAALDFDYAKVTEQSRDNPVFYVQYAHARIRSVMRNAAEAFPGRDFSPSALAAVPLDRLADSTEIDLLKRLAQWPRTVEAAAQAHEPHRIAFYLHDLASAFHALWNKGNEDPGLRFIIGGEPDLTAARLALIEAVRTAIASGLAVMGVEPVEEMR